MVGEAISDALSNKSDEELSIWCFPEGKIRNTLTTALERASAETATKAAGFEVRQRIGTEEFIDEVVARIQRKQIPG